VVPGVLNARWWHASAHGVKMEALGDMGKSMHRLQETQLTRWRFFWTRSRSLSIVIVFDDVGTAKRACTVVEHHGMAMLPPESLLLQTLLQDPRL